MKFPYSFKTSPHNVISRTEPHKPDDGVADYANPCCWDVAAGGIRLAEQSFGWTLPPLLVRHPGGRLCVTQLAPERSIIFWPWRTKPGKTLSCKTISGYSFFSTTWDRTWSIRESLNLRCPRMLISYFGHFLLDLGNQQYDTTIASSLGVIP